MKTSNVIVSNLIALFLILAYMPLAFSDTLDSSKTPNDLLKTLTPPTDSAIKTITLPDGVYTRTDRTPCWATMAPSNKGKYACGSSDGSSRYCYATDKYWYMKACSNGCDKLSGRCKVSGDTNAGTPSSATQSQSNPQSARQISAPVGYTNTNKGPCYNWLSKLWRKGSYECLSDGSSWYCNAGDRYWYKKGCGTNGCASDGKCLDGYVKSGGDTAARKKNNLGCLNGVSTYYDGSGNGYIMNCDNSGCDDEKYRCKNPASTSATGAPAAPNNAQTTPNNPSTPPNNANTGTQQNTNTPKTLTISNILYEQTPETCVSAGKYECRYTESYFCADDGYIYYGKCRSGCGSDGKCKETTTTNIATTTTSNQLPEGTPLCIRYSIKGPTKNLKEPNPNTPEICMDTPIMVDGKVKYSRDFPDILKGTSGSTIMENVCDSNNKCATTDSQYCRYGAKKDGIIKIINKIKSDKPNWITENLGKSHIYAFYCG